MPGGAGQPRKQLDAWQEWAKQRGARGLAYVLVGEDGSVSERGPVVKNLSDAEREGWPKAAGAEPGDCVFFAAGHPAEARGAARRRPRRDRAPLRAGRRVGVVVRVGRRRADVRADQGRPGQRAGLDGGAPPVHLAQRRVGRPVRGEPGEALAYAYDIVCNGNEIGGGSIRIHRSDVQERVFALLGMDEAEQREKFGFLLDAFAYGPPPHGGIAFGWDRVCMLLAGAESLREVIAFPKTGGGFDPLTGAPAPITLEQRREAGIDARPPVAPGEPPTAPAVSKHT